MEKHIQTEFDNISLDYDRQRKQLIPCFEDFYGLAVSIIEPTGENPVVLDIGAGTGLFTAFLLRRVPGAQVTLIDISEKMLQAARERFTNVDGLNYIAADYTRYDFSQKYDIIISALSIHHLCDSEKAHLYNKIYSILQPKGIFINCDQVLGDTSYLESLYKRRWKSSIENSGLSVDEISAAYERTKLDKEATLSQQLTWLRQAGFSDVDCVYKYYHFAVMVGRK